MALGDTWTARTGTTGDWRSVAYGNGTFVAVCTTGTYRVMTSTDAVTWTARSAAQANTWLYVGFANDLFIAFSNDGTNRIMTSPDGITWTARTDPGGGSVVWRSVTYGNGTYVAVGTRASGTSRVMTSTNGTSWTLRTAAEANSWRSVTYGNGVFVAVASDGTNRVMTSTDGITWTARSASAANGWQSVTYGNSTFVAVADSGTNRAMTSSDGVTWTGRTPTGNDWQSITFGSGVFVAVTYGGTYRVNTSTDGITWADKSAAQANTWLSVTYGGGLAVAVSQDGTNRVMSSEGLAAPGAPTALSATRGNTEVALTWTAPASDGGSAITDYLVEYKPSGGAWTTFSDGTSTSTSATVTGLTNGTSYDFRVSAINAVGTGAASSTATATPATTPGQPVYVSATGGNAQVALTWTAPASDGGSAITDYLVEYKPFGGAWTTFADGTSTSTSATVTGLTNGTSYEFRVSAINAVGTGSPWASNPSVIPDVVPDTPTGLTADGNSATAITLTWTAPASNGGTALTGYSIQYKENSSGTWLTATSPSSPTAMSSLNPETKYDFRVAGVNAAGTGAYTATVSAYPLTVVSGVLVTMTMDTLDASITMDGDSIVDGELVTMVMDTLDASVSFEGTITQDGELVTMVMDTLDATARAELRVAGELATMRFELEAFPTLIIPVAPAPAGVLDPTTGVFLIEPDADLIEEVAGGTYATYPQPIRALHKVQPQMPDPLTMLGTLGRPKSNEFIPTSVTTAPIGLLRVTVEGRDVTYLRGVPVQIASISEAEPFGWGTATINFPQLSPYEDPNTGDRAFLRAGYDIDITLVDLEGDLVETLFEGIIIETDQTVDTNTVGINLTATGVLYQADHILASKRLVVNEVDLYQRVMNRLNIVPGRRYQRRNPYETTTGITNHDAGSWQALLTGYIQDLLADATTDDGQNQWTLTVEPGRRPVIRLKDRETVHHTVVLGTPGVNVNLHKDVTQATTTLYGHGVDANNDAYANLRLPNRDANDNNAAYPFTNPATVLTAGDTDADTDSGTGVTVLQKRLRRAGLYGRKVKGSWTIPLTGVYDTNTVKAVKRWQQSHGESVTGNVGGQTWTRMFSTGNVLEGAWYAPFATVSQVEPWVYTSDGAHVLDEDGKWVANPDFDPNRIRVEKWRAFTDGLSKEEAARAAYAEVLRDSEAGWTGTISLQVDPEDTTRWGIHAGHNILVKGWDGDELLLHIASVNRDVKGNVTLQVDSKARDLLTLDAIEARDREATGASRRKNSPARQGDLSPSRPIIDSELVGWLDQITLEAETWVVTRVPLGTVGTIVGLDISTDDPTRFCFALFSGAVSPAALNSLGLDRPLEFYSGTSTSPFQRDQETIDALDALGFLDAIGGPGQAAGYYPGAEDREDPVTGRHQDKGISLSFESQDELWVWVAVWAEDAAFLDGRIFVAPQV